MIRYPEGFPSDARARVVHAIETAEHDFLQDRRPSYSPEKSADYVLDVRAAFLRELCQQADWPIDQIRDIEQSFRRQLIEDTYNDKHPRGLQKVSAIAGDLTFVDARDLLADIPAAQSLERFTVLVTHLLQQESFWRRFRDHLLALSSTEVERPDTTLKEPEVRARGAEQNIQTAEVHRTGHLSVGSSGNTDVRCLMPCRRNWGWAPGVASLHTSTGA